MLPNSIKMHSEIAYTNTKGLLIAPECQGTESLIQQDSRYYCNFLKSSTTPPSPLASIMIKTHHDSSKMNEQQNYFKNS